MSDMDKLRQLKQMLDNDLITQEEFDEKKRFFFFFFSLLA